MYYTLFPSMPHSDFSLVTPIAKAEPLPVYKIPLFTIDHQLIFFPKIFKEGIYTNVFI